MKLKITILIIYVMTICCSQAASIQDIYNIKNLSADTLYGVLQDVLSHKSDYVKRKEERIDSLKVYSDQYSGALEVAKQYHTFQYDSAMVYIGKAIQLAEGDAKKHIEVSILQAEIEATAGLYSEAQKILDAIDIASLPEKLKLPYYQACLCASNIMGEFTQDKQGQLLMKRKQYSDSILKMLPKESPEWLYLKAEHLQKSEFKAREKLYKECIKNARIEDRIFASASCGLAICYKQKGGYEEYVERYLLMAVIADNVQALKENLASQLLADYIACNEEKNISLAHRLLINSLEDAMFFNNRLRLMQISRRMPDIVLKYEAQLKKANRHQTWAIINISILSLALATAVFLTIRANKKLSVSKNKQQQINLQLSQLNNELANLNKKLKDTNNSREECVSLFFNLCASYTNKLTSFKKTVERKVKVGQTDDLIRIVRSAHLSEVESREFFFHFDQAFITLYPTFVNELNKLLRPDAQILLKKGEILNTELRIAALIRMGVNDATKLSTLLFYSPQTIYNYRSQLKSRAIQRETFEKDLEQLGITND